MRVIPSNTALWTLAAGAACILLALVAGIPLRTAEALAWAWALALLGAASADYLMTRQAWKRASPRLSRRLPDALAIGVKSEIQLFIQAEGRGDWRCKLFDYVDPTLLTDGLPASATVPGNG